MKRFNLIFMRYFSAFVFIGNASAISYFIEKENSAAGLASAIFATVALRELIEDAIARRPTKEAADGR